MRSTQLQTLRAVAAGADTLDLAAERLGSTINSTAARIAKLVESGYLTRFSQDDEHQDGSRWIRVTTHYALTAKACAMLQRRDELDGSTP